MPLDQAEAIRAGLARPESSSGRANRKWAHSLTIKKQLYLDGLGTLLEGCPRIRESSTEDQIGIMATTLADAAQMMDSSLTFYVMVDGFKAPELHTDGQPASSPVGSRQEWSSWPGQARKTTGGLFLRRGCSTSRRCPGRGLGRSRLRRRRGRPPIRRPVGPGRLCRSVPSASGRRRR